MDNRVVTVSGYVVCINPGDTYLIRGKVYRILEQNTDKIMVYAWNKPRWYKLNKFISLMIKNNTEVKNTFDCNDLHFCTCSYKNGSSSLLITYKIKLEDCIFDPSGIINLKLYVSNEESEESKSYILTDL